VTIDHHAPLFGETTMGHSDAVCALNHYESLISAQETTARKQRSFCRRFHKKRKRTMSSRKILYPLSASFVMASLAVSLGGGGAAAADAQRIATTNHYVYKSHVSHRLYNYNNAGSERRLARQHCIIPTPESIRGICWYE
jgi:hypothetical protein